MNDPRYWQRRNERFAMLETTLCQYTVGSTKRMGNFSSAFEKANKYPCRLSLQRDEFLSRVGNLFPNRQQLYEVGAVAFKGSNRMQDGRIFRKISAAHSLMMTYQMNLF
jgi:hypothetical protein